MYRLWNWVNRQQVAHVTSEITSTIAFQCFNDLAQTPHTQSSAFGVELELVADGGFGQQRVGTAVI